MMMRVRRCDRRTYQREGCINKVSLGDGSKEVQKGESSGEIFCKFHLESMNWSRVLRPKCSTFDKCSNDSLQ